MFTRFAIALGLSLLALLAGACAPAARLVIPTDLPTVTDTHTPTATRTPGRDATPTERPTLVAIAATAGPSPTPLIAPTITLPAQSLVTPTRPPNPNAPRIEFFTSDLLAVEPGATVTLFWSVRGISTAVIYRLDAQGARSQVFNVPPEGRLPVTTRRSDRGQVEFILSAGQGSELIEQRLTIPLRCPVEWFFQPAPQDCAVDVATETGITDQTMERGRMLYIEAQDLVYVLFNDGQQPAWLSFPSDYDPAIHPERDDSAPPEFIQPLRELGLIWRTNQVVRDRLGLGRAEGATYDGFIQEAPASGNARVLYISGADGRVIQVQPGGEIWQIVGP